MLEALSSWYSDIYFCVVADYSNFIGEVEGKHIVVGLKKKGKVKRAWGDRLFGPSLKLLIINCLL